MLRVSAATILAFLAYTTGSIAQQQITSPDGTIFYCPTQETIAVAYLNYCPTSDGNNVPLIGTSSGASYPNAPESFQSVANGHYIICDYGDTGEGVNLVTRCEYRMGGGQPATLAANQPEQCRQARQDVPQPSAGYNYKRSVAARDLAKRAEQAQFVCPWTSNNATRYSRYDQINNGYRGGETGITYDCVFMRPDGQTTFGCSYVKDPTLGPVGFAQDGVDVCPSTLCDAIYTESNVARRAFREGSDVLRKRQLDASKLRKRAAAPKPAARKRFAIRK